MIVNMRDGLGQWLHRPGFSLAEFKAQRAAGTGAAKPPNDVRGSDTPPHREPAAGPEGLAAGLRDRFVGKSLALMHAKPAHPWTVDELAGRVGLSRSALAERFTALVGAPPMQTDPLAPPVGGRPAPLGPAQRRRCLARTWDTNPRRRSIGRSSASWCDAGGVAPAPATAHERKITRKHTGDAVDETPFQVVPAVPAYDANGTPHFAGIRRRLSQRRFGPGWHGTSSGGGNDLPAHWAEGAFPSSRLAGLGLNFLARGWRGVTIRRRTPSTNLAESILARAKD